MICPVNFMVDELLFIIALWLLSLKYMYITSSLKISQILVRS